MQYKPSNVVSCVKALVMRKPAICVCECVCVCVLAMPACVCVRIGSRLGCSGLD